MSRWLKRLFHFFLIVFLGGAVGLFWLFSQRDITREVMVSVKEQRTIEQAVKGIEITTSTADVHVMRSNVPNPHLELIGNISKEQREQIQWKSEVTADGTLQVKVIESEGAPDFFKEQGWLRLQVLLPESDTAYEKLHVRTNRADVNIEAVSAKQGNISVHIGDIELSGFVGDTLEISSEIGDIKLMDAQAAMQVSSSTGDVQILNVPELLYPLHVSAEIGDVDISFANPPTAVDLKLATQIGDVEVDWEKGSYTEGGPTIEAKTSMGDIRIQ